MGLEDQGARPHGFTGKLLGVLMNRFHTNLYEKYFNGNLPAPCAAILDLGCGGGRFVKYLSDQNVSYAIVGADHSDEMCKLSAKINRNAIKEGRVKIYNSAVAEIDLPDNSFDLITALETIQFWPETVRCFYKIYRLLKPGGRFIIINRYPKEGSKWWARASVRDEAGYIQKLTMAGFTKQLTDLKFSKGWIVVKGIK